MPVPDYRTRAEQDYQNLVDNPYEDEEDGPRRRSLPNREEFLARAVARYGRQDERARLQGQEREQDAISQLALRAKGAASQGRTGTYAQGLRPNSGLEMGDVIGGIQTFRPSGQEALIAGARYTGLPVGGTTFQNPNPNVGVDPGFNRGIGDYLAGGGLSPGGGGGRVGPTSGQGGVATQQRPFWQNYDNEELMALSPGALAALPPEAFATMPNDIFVKYPQLLSKLQPQDIEKRGFGLDFQQANRIGQYALRPDEVQPSGAPTYPGLRRTGIVPPRVQAGLSPLARGNTGTSPFRVDYSKAQIRRPSAQTFYGGFNPTDREATLATFEGVGLNPQDVEGDIRGPGGGGRRFFSIGEAPRRPQVRY